MSSNLNKTHQSTAAPDFPLLRWILAEIPTTNLPGVWQSAKSNAKALSMPWNVARRIQELVETTSLMLGLNKKFYADQHRREVSFSVGDWVMLRSDVIDGSRRTDLPKKWQAKYLGPFEVKEVRGPVNYMIEMPPSMKRKHNVFHVSKLKPSNRPANEVRTLSVVIDAGGNTEQIVHQILDKKREKRRVFYLVQFYGDSKEAAIWMHKSELKNCMDLVKDFRSIPGNEQRGR